MIIKFGMDIYTKCDALLSINIHIKINGMLSYENKWYAYEMS